ncbi:PTS sugar transporter subunit IIA [Anaerovibrio sp.]|uniref:PTS sugar transporter subunit IIA n=1 Tax=Anaerovibrio sp. TaxID=1872532 RepID=UPI003F13C050
MSTNRYLVLSGHAQNSEEAISICADALHKAGIVGDEFGRKCCVRERSYPTGLPTEIPVAIPHCKDTGIQENAICILRLDKPVTFYRMDDDEEKIETRLVLNLAIKNPNEHLAVLQNLMGFLNNSDEIRRCMELPETELIDYLTAKIG